MRISDWSSDVCSSDLGVTTVTSDAKQRLVRLIGHDLRLGGAVSPVSMAAQRLAQSLARSFEERKPTLALFDPPDTLDWASLGGCVRQVLQIGGHGAGHAALRSSVFFCSRSSYILR